MKNELWFPVLKSCTLLTDLFNLLPMRFGLTVKPLFQKAVMIYMTTRAHCQVNIHRLDLAFEQMTNAVAVLGRMVLSVVPSPEDPPDQEMSCCQKLSSYCLDCGGVQTSRLKCFFSPSATPHKWTCNHQSTGEYERVFWGLSTGISAGDGGQCCFPDMVHLNAGVWAHTKNWLHPTNCSFLLLHFFGWMKRSHGLNETCRLLKCRWV